MTTQKPPDKPIVHEVVVVSKDDTKAVLHPPEFGEIRMVFQNGRLMQRSITDTENNVIFK